MTGTWIGVPSVGRVPSVATRRNGGPDTSPLDFLFRHKGSRNVATPAANGTIPTNEPMITAATLARTLRRGAAIDSDSVRGGNGGVSPPGGVAFGLSDLAIVYAQGSKSHVQGPTFVTVSYT